MNRERCIVDASVRYEELRIGVTMRVTLELEVGVISCDNIVFK